MPLAWLTAPALQDHPGRVSSAPPRHSPLIPGRRTRMNDLVSRDLNRLLMALLTVGLLTTSALAADTEEEASRQGTRFSVASDPAAWMMNGYSGIVMLEPSVIPHWRMSAEVFGLTFPEVVVELSEANRGHGWQRQIIGSGVLYVDYHPRGHGEGWHLGGAVNLMFSRLTREGIDGESSLTTLELLGRGGYRWFPVDGWGLFLNPWVGLGALLAIEEPAPVGDRAFEEPPVQFLGTVHVGWRFGASADERHPGVSSTGEPAQDP